MRVRTLLAAALALLVLQAWSSDGYYFPDDELQVVELQARPHPSDLAWEFREQMRPFLQPSAYAAGAAVGRAVWIPRAAAGAPLSR